MRWMAEDSSGWHGATGCGLFQRERLGDQLLGSPDLSVLLFCCSAAEACLTSQGEATQKTGSLSAFLHWDGKTELKRKEGRKRDKTGFPPG